MEEHSDLDAAVVCASVSTRVTAGECVEIRYPDGCYVIFAQDRTPTLREIIDHHQSVHKKREMKKAKVILFKPSGKYYTEEEWEIPDGCVIPYGMINSKDFRRINHGSVLVETQEPWGYPHLFPGEVE